MPLATTSVWYIAIFETDCFVSDYVLGAQVRVPVHVAGPELRQAGGVLRHERVLDRVNVGSRLVPVLLVALECHANGRLEYVELVSAAADRRALRVVSRRRFLRHEPQAPGGA